MAYNRRKLLRELDRIISETPSIRLSEIARMLGIDRHTIENAIRASRNISFREYKRRELLNKARTMLDQADISVKEVGIRLGYSSPASFSRFVHQATGKSPSELRRESA